MVNYRIVPKDIEGLIQSGELNDLSGYDCIPISGRGGAVIYDKEDKHEQYIDSDLSLDLDNWD